MQQFIYRTATIAAEFQTIADDRRLSTISPAVYTSVIFQVSDVRII